MFKFSETHLTTYPCCSTPWPARWRASVPPPGTSPSGGRPTRAGLDLRQRQSQSQSQSHILAQALDRLAAAPRRVLHTLAGLRLATGYVTLRDLLVRTGGPCPDEANLDRGLLSWERGANRYDLHPIVRGGVWAGLGVEIRRAVLEGLSAHFAAQPMVEDWQKMESLTDLGPAIELYDKLIGLGRLQQAFELFRNRIGEATFFRLGAAHHSLELLRALFPNGEQALPGLEGTGAQGHRAGP